MSQCTHFVLETNYAFLFTISNYRNVSESNYVHQQPFLYVSVLRILVKYQVSYINQYEYQFSSVLHFLP